MEYIKKIANIQHIEHLQGNLRGKKVIVRVDFNVPISNGVITDTYRIDSAIKTFDFLQKEGAISILLSHIETKGVEPSTLIPVYTYILQTYPQYVFYFCKDFLQKKELQEGLDKLKHGEFLLCENIRIADKTGMSEKLNDDGLAEYLKEFADFYIQDAFAVSHRKHTSVVKLAQLFDTEHKAAGFQLYAEIHALLKVLEPEKPFAAILSGAKFSTKLPLIEKYLEHADIVLVGGALYNNVLKSLGYNVGRSLIDAEAVYVDELVQKKMFTDKVYIPEYVVVTDVETGKMRESHIRDIQDTESIMDIAKKSILDFISMIQKKDVKTILWNGPVGNFEVAPFDEGTKTLATELVSYVHMSSLQDIRMIVGGGDTVSAINTIDEMSKNTNVWISTGGGAMLEFLEKEGQLPGIVSLL